ncbi:urease accessory protein UreG [Aliarcobacter butzleri RM4018]|uniref:Urease accessory protein UreG n=1 Tax=Aliarcobacter butzleri (strain RM4018) TaxID=367737 RepID=UREG_ALIB4|nr:urease accessory protein UreG [Aliarcobacter butzleri]A8ET01.1 RecName: Full=Urease accessory protein UreG [Aliarcobacter butzleri RM4018]ABV67075.1 urease accessory protein UreG [Aliarcobacter butzleri RM4018]MCG3663813.1 urease accessory protein UreG [Aliarcobacter butzleri]SNV26647.1 Urease accessory protein UreG [Aliarcobacter butzleri]GGT84977.1 urease accessory protein UreG [Aliarcobacter butzleri]
MSLKIGIAGPVGSGKTSLIESLTNLLKDKYSLGIVTNDIYTTEDANYLKKTLDLDNERIIGVETGGCPHTAIRDDISMNQKAVVELEEKFNPDIVFVESGGDNLSATFSYELIDYYIYVIDVAQGADIPRKKGAGLLFSDLLIVNKTDLAPYVEIDLVDMQIDVKENRKNKPYVFISKKEPQTLNQVVSWIEALI